MKTKLLALLVLAGGSLLAGPRVVVALESMWVARTRLLRPAASSRHRIVRRALSRSRVQLGGWILVSGGSRYSWRAGYWAQPPYRGARWVAPAITAAVTITDTGDASAE